MGGLFADPVAETCLAGILALYRGIDVLAGLRADESWARHDVRPGLRLLGGADVLILGRGSIARRLAELLAPFGCTVSHFARGDGDLRTREELDARLPEFDIVVGLLPGTEQTADLFDERRIGLLRPGAVFVNASTEAPSPTRTRWSPPSPPGASAARSSTSPAKSRSPPGTPCGAART